MIFKIRSRDTWNVCKYPVPIYFCIALLILLPGIACAAEPVIFEMIPSESVNTSIIPVSFYGENFTTGASVVMVPVNSLPVHKGSISNGTGGALLDWPVSVDVSGNYAYVASAISNALEIIDISDPANPVHISTIEAGSFPSGVAVLGNYAYVINSDPDSLKIIDISDPARPVEKNRTMDPKDNVTIGGASSIFVSGNYAYITYGADEVLEIVNISDAARPVRESRIMHGNGGALHKSPYDVYKSGDYAYVVSYGDNALEIVDVSDPVNPVHKGSIVNGEGGALLDLPRGVYASGNYAYVASFGSNALEIIDVSDPAKPVHKGKIEDGDHGALLGTPHDVFVSGNYAYISSVGSNALEIVDISNPARPVHKSSIRNDPAPKRTGASLNQPHGIDINGGYAYIASFGSDTLEIVDIGTITGTDVMVISPTQMTCSFDVKNKASGLYSVFITNPDGSQGIAPIEFGVGVHSMPRPARTPDLDPGFAITCIGLLSIVVLGRFRKRSE
jgi:hypothetical protein